MINLIALSAVLLTQHHHSAPPEAAQKSNISKFGKYQAELRLPDGGLYAGEEIDVEFRVTDTTQKDPVEEGFKGVGAIEATALVTMPSMAGMPPAKPKVHREGVPGDYGIELFFPHGGDYKIDLTLNIPGDGVKKASFLVDVRDEKPAAAHRPLPYKLKVVDWPKNAKAGASTVLKLQVIDSKTGAVQKKFDEAHTKYFHLLVASKDLNWFLHEHPTMDASGTWSVPIKFPAGTDYWVYGDVAPSGKGSQVLINSVKVSGPKPTWNTNLVLTTSSVDRGLKAKFATLQPIQIGKKSSIEIRLTDAKTGKAAGDTIPWLGAAGHLMIFHQDGQTVVHSHPEEDKENAALVKKGVVRFNGRFPKAGKYKVYAQFNWKGKIHTLPFAIEVKK